MNVLPACNGLRFVEQSPLFDKYDAQLSAFDPSNATIVGQKVSVYRCPSMVLPRQVPSATCGETAAPASYAVCTGSLSASGQRLIPNRPLRWPAKLSQKTGRRRRPVTRKFSMPLAPFRAGCLFAWETRFSVSNSRPAKTGAT